MLLAVLKVVKGVLDALHHANLVAMMVVMGAVMAVAVVVLTNV